MYRILTVNPGATSTKIGVFEDDKKVLGHTFEYSEADLAGFETVHDQIPLRWKDIKEYLDENGVTSIDAAVGRGGLVGPVQPGAIEVNQALLDRLQYRPVLVHASNIGAALSKQAADELGTKDCKVLIYDPVTVDEMDDVCRVTGLKEIQRKSIGHHLNMRKVAIDLANKLGKDYNEASVIVLHMGGGSSASLHQDGRIVDFISDDEIQFSVERSGGLPLKDVIKRAQKVGLDVLGKEIRGGGGLVSHFGTRDARDVEELVASSDEYAKLVSEAMALQIAKAMATLAVSAKGRVDGFALTGGIAYWKGLCEMVRERIEFIAPFHPYPGEFELEALAEGGLRVLRGMEQAHVFTE